jgi:hypothetical protein
MLADFSLPRFRTVCHPGRKYSISPVLMTAQVCSEG